MISFERGLLRLGPEFDVAEPATPDGVGALSVLNCGAGDLKFSFDPADPAEVERAKKTVEDMMKRGYVLMVEVDGKWRRAKSFDPNRCEYLLEEAPAAEPGSAEEEGPRLAKKTRRIPAQKVRSLAVAPTSGG